MSIGRRVSREGSCGSGGHSSHHSPTAPRQASGGIPGRVSSVESIVAEATLEQAKRETGTTSPTNPAPGAPAKFAVRPGWSKPKDMPLHRGTRRKLANPPAHGCGRVAISYGVWCLAPWPKKCNTFPARAVAHAVLIESRPDAAILFVDGAASMEST